MRKGYAMRNNETNCTGFWWSFSKKGIKAWNKQNIRFFFRWKILSPKKNMYPLCLCKLYRIWLFLSLALFSLSFCHNHEPCWVASWLVNLTCDFVDACLIPSWDKLSEPIPTQWHLLTPLGNKPLENTVEKGEIAHNEQFLLYPQCFLPV